MRLADAAAGIFASIQKILEKEENFLKIFFFLLSVIVPGLSLIFAFYNQYIFDLDIIKLILLSITFSIPFHILGLFTYYFSTDTKKLDLGGWFINSLVLFYVVFFFFLGEGPRINFLTLFSGIVETTNYDFNFLNFWVFSVFFTFLLVFLMLLVKVWDFLKKKFTKGKKKK